MSEAPAAPGGRQHFDPGADPLARTVFALLVIACMAAFFVTQRLKHTPTAVQLFQRTPRFSPYPTGHNRLEQISFKLKQADDVTVTIIDSRGDVVATLVRDYPVPRYKQFSLRWNGRRGTSPRYTLTRLASGRAVVVAHNRGHRAPPGEYRVRLGLRHEHRSFLSPWSFTLVAP